LRKIRLNKGIYTIFFDFNGNNIIQKNNIEIYKELKGAGSSNVTLTFETADLINVETITSLKKRSIDINSTNSIGLSIEPTTDNPNYKLLVYKSSNSNILKINKDIICDVLIVGGGGGGGWYGGGGGGGGVVEKKNYLLKKGIYNITIGEGGIGWRWRKAGDSLIMKDNSNILAAGGGGNGQSNGYDDNTDGNIVVYGTEKNSGGGGGSANYNSTGLGKLSGNRISGYGGRSPKTDRYSSGGGGGAGGNGENGTTDKGGNGGKGKLSNITGRNEYYGGGGGGSYGDKIAGSGTDGGGDGGIHNPVGITGEFGVVNKGGGGGGGTKAVERVNGGSGIVIFRVKREDIEDEVDISNELLTSTDTRIINEINNLLEKKIIEFNNEEKPYNYLGILPLVILLIIIWLFIFLFLLKFVHHYFASIYIYILLFIIIFLLIFGSLWFLYTNNDIL
jgi:hypothetical protein